MFDVEALRQENAAQRAQIAELLSTIAKLNDRVAELLAIAQRKQRKTAAPTEKKPAPAPVLEAAARQAFSRGSGLPGRGWTPQRPAGRRSRWPIRVITMADPGDHDGRSA